MKSFGFFILKATIKEQSRAIEIYKEKIEYQESQLKEARSAKLKELKKVEEQTLKSRETTQHSKGSKDKDAKAEKSKVTVQSQGISACINLNIFLMFRVLSLLLDIAAKVFDLEGKVINCLNICTNIQAMDTML